jgi:hypothetical protein
MMFKFEEKSVPDQGASEKAGAPQFRTEHWVSIIIDDRTEVPLRFAGSDGTVDANILRMIDMDNLDERILGKYEAWRAGGTEALDGSDLREWPAVTKAQADSLRALSLLTIEDLAEASDGLLQRMQGGVTLREKAQAWLKEAQSTGTLAEENRKLAAQLQALEEQLKELQAVTPAKRAKR